MPPLGALPLDPALGVATSFVDPLFGLVAAAPEFDAVGCAVVGSAWAALCTFVPMPRPADDAFERLLEVLRQ